MRYIVTGKEMKLLDQNTSEHFNVPTVVLMEQAAMTFVQELFVRFKEIDKVLVVCGTGNNGADGIAISRLLNQKGIHSEIYTVDRFLEKKMRTTELFDLQREIYNRYGFPECYELDSDMEYSIVIDAVFGIGLSRNIEGRYSDLLSILNELKGIKIAVDMPSGISADNGMILGNAFRADHTFTFSFGKIGQYLWPGNEYSGEVVICDMGITADSFLEEKGYLIALEKADLFLRPKRISHSNKGTYGKLLIVAGSDNMAGAAYFSAKAAYRAGTGLVKVYTSDKNRTIIQNKIPEAILDTYIDIVDIDKLTNAIDWADAVVLGPGLSTDDNTKLIVKTVLEKAKVPLVADADALNIISDNIEYFELLKTEMIITPHLGEMSRLTGRSVSDIQSNIIEVAREFSDKYKIVCVLKDFRTITASYTGNTYVNLSGNNGMATAGSGDVLAGIIGALLAQGAGSEIAASLGVFIHGMAGDKMLNKTGYQGMMASDIIDGLNDIWNQVI